MTNKRGRPPAHAGEVRVQFGCKVAPETDAQIRAEVQESGRSAGQVIDRWAGLVAAPQETEERRNDKSAL